MLRATARWLVSFSPLYMPALSPSMETGTIVEWKKKEGELVKEGDVICSIQTDKAIVDFTNTFDAGYLAKILMPNGSAVAVAATIALLVEDAADVAKLANYNPVASTAVPVSPKPSTGTTTSTGAAESSSSSRFGASLKEVIEASGPSVMRIAASLNPDLMKDIRPSGKGGRFLKSDFINVPGFNYDDAVTVPVKSAEPKTSGSRSLAAVRDPNAALDPLSVVLSASPVKDFGVSDSKLLRVLGNMAVAAPKQKTLLARK